MKDTCPAIGHRAAHALPRGQRDAALIFDSIGSGRITANLAGAV